MTFTERVCAELMELPIKKNCCRRALSAGLLLPAMRQPGGRVVLQQTYLKKHTLKEQK